MIVNCTSNTYDLTAGVYMLCKSNATSELLVNIIIMEIQYKKKIVAFIDVLGFSGIVLNSNYSLIVSYFSYLKDSIKQITKGKKISVYYISDSIIISAPNTIGNLYKIIDAVRYIQAQLLSKNILTRGGISIGDFYLSKKENIIVGPALVNSYNLESLAKYPRVIIDRGIMKQHNFLTVSKFKTYINSKSSPSEILRELISTDRDNYIYVNYLSYISSRRQHYTSKKTIEHFYNFLQEYFLQNQYLDKYVWLREKIILELDFQYSLAKKVQPSSHKTRQQQNKFLIEIPKWIKKFDEL